MSQTGTPPDRRTPDLTITRIALALAIALCAPLKVATWPRRLRWWKLPSFIILMLKLSVNGALEVARLAMSQRCDANTLTHTYRFRCLTQQPQQLLMANLVNLTPGTLTLRISCDALYIHILHHHPRVEAQLKVLESRIAGLYGLKHESWEHEP
ncbi:cation:proton antiporter [Vreelandella rituensis]|uniref:Cation:proton antiporter n=1 Tax=Vreelandella rituensis TaxID=2282306 RepID=A0A368U5J2_9GAMM|nr:cation:proton antiporter [Halomonas rituensis]